MTRRVGEAQKQLLLKNEKEESKAKSQKLKANSQKPTNCRTIRAEKIDLYKFYL